MWKQTYSSVSVVAWLAYIVGSSGCVEFRDEVILGREGSQAHATCKTRRLCTPKVMLAMHLTNINIRVIYTAKRSEKFSQNVHFLLKSTDDQSIWVKIVIFEKILPNFWRTWQKFWRKWQIFGENEQKFLRYSSPLNSK